MLYRLILFGCLLTGTIQVSGQEHWTVRADLSGKTKIKVDKENGWKVYSKASQTCFSKPITTQWETYTLRFVPEADGSAILSLRSTTGFDVISSPWIILASISAEGCMIKNGDFKKLDKQGLLRSWRGKIENTVKDPAAARVNFDNSLSQRITFQKNIPVIIKFKARLTPSMKPALPEWSNAVTDRITNIQTLISSGRVAFRPTFENCGIYVNQKKGEYGKKLDLKLFYRKAGTSVWLPALDPVYIPIENAWRGSIMLLQENTEYEVKGIISGELTDQFSGRFKTLNSKVKIAETIILDPSNFPGDLEIKKSGTPNGYIRYTMKSGVLKGNAKKQAVIILNNVSYIIIENLTIDCNRTPGGIQIIDSNNIQVTNCNIYNFGRVGVQRLDHGGKFYAGSSLIYYDPGIEIKNSRDVLVERCFIHNPASTSNTWFYSHPAGPSALRVQTTEGVVLRYNDLVGNDQGRFIDVIHAPVNSHITGGFTRDADIYGNLLIFSNDDAIEMEGGGMSCRFYLNRLEGTYTGVSTGVCRLGPIYQFRNLFARPGDEEHRYGLPFKNTLSVQGYGAIFFINNTLVNQAPRVVWSSFHRKPPEEKFKSAFKAFSRNNIAPGKKTFYDPKLFDWKIDFDYDLLTPLPTADVNTLKAEYARVNQGKHNIYASPVYIDAASGDFHLAPGSPGRGQAVKLSNLSCTNMGAFQDDGIKFLPHRKLPLTPEKQEIYFQSHTSPLSQTFDISVTGKDYNKPFEVYCNDDFFDVEPKSGVFKSGDRLTFTVTLKPDKMPLPRRYNGVILLRVPEGLSLPVSIYADYRHDKKRQKEALKSSIVIPVKIDHKNPVTEVEVNIPEDGVYFLFAKAENIGLVKEIRIRLGACDTKNMARLLGPKMRNETTEYYPVTNGYLSAYYFKLKAGKQKLNIRINDLGGDNSKGEISQLLITRRPGLFVW